MHGKVPVGVRKRTEQNTPWLAIKNADVNGRSRSRRQGFISLTLEDHSAPAGGALVNIKEGNQKKEKKKEKKKRRKKKKK